MPARPGDEDGWTDGADRTEGDRDDGDRDETAAMKTVAIGAARAAGATRRTGGRFDPSEDLLARAARFGALGDPTRLAIVEDLVLSDRAPKDLSERLGVASNLLAHHLEVLEAAGLVVRSASSGDRRRKYVRLVRPSVVGRGVGTVPNGPMLFVCTHNSARSQLAAALWRHRTGAPATSAGTDPARQVHRGAVAAARRAGLAIGDARPCALGNIPIGSQVVTVCDRAHEELSVGEGWWHWSVPDPVPSAMVRAFDDVVAELDARIAAVVALQGRDPAHRPAEHHGRMS